MLCVVVVVVVMCVSGGRSTENTGEEDCRWCCSCRRRRCGILSSSSSFVMAAEGDNGDGGGDGDVCLMVSKTTVSDKRISIDTYRQHHACNVPFGLLDDIFGPSSMDCMGGNETRSVSMMIKVIRGRKRKAVTRKKKSWWTQNDLGAHGYPEVSVCMRVLALATFADANCPDGDDGSW